MKLVSMTDFVIEQSKLTGYDISDYDWIIRIVNYAKFLKQPLKLEMFVPYDENHGGVLKKPCDEELEKFKGLQYGDFDCNYTYIFDYNQAKEKVLFEGFEVKGNYIMYYDFAYMMKYELEGKTVENIIDEIPNNRLQLTQNALKQFL